MALGPVKLEDEAKTLKNLKKDDPEIVKYFQSRSSDEFELIEEFMDWLISGDKFRKIGKKILADSRRGYTMTDKRLKELRKNKVANKDRIAEMLKMRMYFYDNGSLAKIMVKTATIKK